MPTARPWTFEPENGRVIGPPHEHPQSREIGVDMAESHPIICFVRGHQGNEEAKANGELIADAPDILAALVSWWDRSSAEDGDEYMEALGWDEVGKLAQQARELLKK